MLCLTRDKPIRLADDEHDAMLDEVYALEKFDLPLAPPPEDEMQQRLADLRKEISGNKLDW